MRKRVAVAAMAMTVGAMTLMAQSERATFILTTGERIAGVVVFHTDARTNIRADKNEFNVGLTDGRELPIPFRQVALIDFIGGTPRNEELAALPADGHLLVKRDGSTEQGRLVDLIGGTHVRWDGKEGDPRDLPIDSVSRVYLNTSSARNIFNYTPPAATPPATGGGSGSGGDARGRQGGGGSGVVGGLAGRFGGTPAGTIDVRAANAWTDTQLTVRQGDRVRFVTTGEIYYTRTDKATADGNVTVRNERFPVPAMAVGGLIGRVGNGKPFAIGSNQAVFTLQENGRLFLGVNDDNYDDNSGLYKVTITRVR